jgi:excisionase family DNA binding protein
MSEAEGDDEAPTQACALRPARVRPRTPVPNHDEPWKLEPRGLQRPLDPTRERFHEGWPDSRPFAVREPSAAGQSWTSRSSNVPGTRERAKASLERAPALKVGDVDLIDAKTLAGKLSVGRTTILRFAREGKIPYYAIGRAWFFSEKEVLVALRRFRQRTNP